MIKKNEKIISMNVPISSIKNSLCTKVKFMESWDKEQEMIDS